MTMYESVTTVLRRYTQFTGTAGRPEFWWFALFSAIVHTALNALDGAVPDGTVSLGTGLSGAFGALVLVPTLAVAVRRLRDTGRSWGNLFWLLLPVAGLVVLVVQLAGESRHEIVPPGPVAPEPTAAR